MKPSLKDEEEMLFARNAIKITKLNTLFSKGNCFASSKVVICRMNAFDKQKGETEKLRKDDERK